jgi:tetratricopeptide (TPR) repeat protein
MATHDHDFEISFFERILKRNPAYPDVIELLGGLYTKQGRVDEGLRMDRRLVRIAPENPIAHYNLACSLALKRRKADAVRALRQAVAVGYRDLDWLREDPDLENLRDYAAFLEIEAEIEKLRAAAQPEPERS